MKNLSGSALLLLATLGGCGVQYEVTRLVAGPMGPAGATGATGAAGIDGRDGSDGVNGQDGANGTDGIDGASPTVISMYPVDPCPSVVGNAYNEVFLCIGTDLYAVFDGGANKDRLVLLKPGHYVTTDDRSCTFQVVTACQVTQ